MKQLQVSSRRRGDTATVTVSGELDISTAGEVERELSSIERGDPRVIVLDLRSLAFIDSSGLRLVISADARARREGRRLALIRGPEPVHRVFLIALLDRRLEFVDESVLADG